MPLVVMIHVFSEPLHSHPTTGLGWPALAIAIAITSWAVPVFMMVSGALLLNGKVTGLRSFYRRRFIRVGVPLIVWSGIYLLYADYYRPAASHTELVKNLFAGSPWGHMYFLFAIVGCYLLVPYLNLMLKSLPRRHLVVLVTLLLVMSSHSEGAVYLELPSSSWTAVTWWVPYLSYFLAGALLRDVRLDRRRVFLAFATVIVTWAASSLVVLWTVRVDPERWHAFYVYGKFSLLTIPMAFATFLALRGIELFRRQRMAGTGDGRAVAFWRELSAWTFGIYLVHPIFIDQLTGTPFMTYYPTLFTGNRGSVLLFVATYALATIFAAIFTKIPLLRRTIS